MIDFLNTLLHTYIIYLHASSFNVCLNNLVGDKSNDTELGVLWEELLFGSLVPLEPY